MNDFTHYERNLPHRLLPGENPFVTIQLAGSLPASALEQLRLENVNAELIALRGAGGAEHSYARQKRYFGRFDALLDNPTSSPTWLRDSTVAIAVGHSLQFFEGSAYESICYTIMPNHLHLVVRLLENGKGLMRTLQRFKSYTALHANRHLGRTGQFWQRESYDHIIRDAPELDRVIAYVLNNPVKAGLIRDWTLWPHTYWKS